jgi:hypothetical protein
MRLDTYDINFIKKVELTISQKYNISKYNLDNLMLKFKDMMIEDPQYVYHYDEEYWADYIAEASGLTLDKLYM